MLKALIFGTISGFSLVLGVFLGQKLKLKQKSIAAFMAFGSGVLICALTFGLMEEAFSKGGFDAVILGFLGGGLVFIIGDYLLHVYGGRKHRRKQIFNSDKEANGKLITLGAILDGIPESIALGVTLFNATGVGLLMLVAIFLSNFPESISSISGLLKENFTWKKIYLLWFFVGLAAIAITVLSFMFLHDISPNAIGIIEAFAAGSILAMLADTMMPEAFEEGGFAIGMLTVFGFLTAFIVLRLASA